MNEKAPAEPDADHTRSGRPNPDDATTDRTSTHQSGYGGQGGEPRTSTDERETPRGTPRKKH